MRLNSDRSSLKDDVTVADLSANSAESFRANAGVSPAKDAHGEHAVGPDLVGGVGERDFSKLLAAAGLTNR